MAQQDAAKQVLSLGDIFAAIESASAKSTGPKSEFVSASALAESKAKFRFTAIELTTNKKFAKEVVRFTIKQDDGTENVLEMSPTEERKMLAAKAAVVIGAPGKVELYKADLPNGKYTYKFRGVK